MKTYRRQRKIEALARRFNREKQSERRYLKVERRNLFECTAREGEKEKQGEQQTAKIFRLYYSEISRLIPIPRAKTVSN